jgi:N-formylmaleamate deformylase
MCTWTGQTIPLNDTFIYYRRSGGDKPPVLLVHGFTDSGACWTRLAQALETEYDVIMPDARGHGQSAAVNGQPVALEDLAQDLLTFSDCLELDRPRALGHSMGAVTLALAAASRPGRFRAIALEDPAWRDSPRRDAAAAQAEGRAWYQWLLDFRQLSDEEAIAQVKVDHPGWAAIDEETYLASRRQFDMSLMPVLNWEAAANWRQTVAEIDCPLLLITGDPARQAIVTPELTERVGQIAAAGQAVHFPGASHHIHQDRFEAYLAALKAFWQAA